MAGTNTTLKKNEYASQDSTGFVGLVLNMSWQLLIVVLVPIIGGAEIDKHQGSKYLYAFIGMAIALALSILVVRRTVAQANSLPVPKLTTAQKLAIKKQYEEEDNE